MKRNANIISDQNAIERWENEGGEVKTIAEVRTNDHAILIFAGCIVVLSLFYWMAKRL